MTGQRRRRRSFGVTAGSARARTRDIVRVTAIPFETGNHHPDYRDAEVWTREVDRNNSLNSKPAQSLQLPSQVDRHVIGIEARNVAKRARIGSLRNGVQ